MIDSMPRNDAQRWYWDVSACVGEVSLQSVGPCRLQLLSHLSDERYHLSSRDELLPLKQPEGIRTYVNAKLYALAPNAAGEMAGCPTFDPTGTVAPPIADGWQDVRPVWLGCARAHYYHEARVITIQETSVEDRFRQNEHGSDAVDLALWQGFERFLAGHFAGARIIATLLDDSPYGPLQYQEFLRTIGYWQLSARAYGKELHRG